MITSISDIESASVKDFMEWFTGQYDGYYLSSDLSNVIPALEGLCAGLGENSSMYNLCKDALWKLRNYRHLLNMLECSHYKYGKVE